MSDIDANPATVAKNIAPKVFHPAPTTTAAHRASLTPARGQVKFLSSSGTVPTGNEIWAERPVLVISPAAVIESMKLATVIPLTSNPSRLQDNQKLVTHFELEQSEIACGMRSIAICEQPITVSTLRLSRRTLFTVSNDQLEVIDQMVALALGLGSQHYTPLLTKWLNMMRSTRVRLDYNAIAQGYGDTKELVDSLRRRINELEEKERAYLTLIADQVRNRPE